MRIQVLGLTVLTVLVGHPLVAQSEWDSAAEQIQRLSPDAFVAVPDHVRRELAEAGCRIPQAWGVPTPSNLVRGSFADADQEDWAALCSDGAESRIVVVWGGPSRCPEKVSDPQSDRNELQRVTSTDIAFTRFLGSTSLAAAHWELPPTVEDIDHEAISDWVLEKGGVAHYCTGGSWILIPGGH